MSCRIDDRWEYNGLRCVTLENEHLRIEVLPELGGKIFRLIDKARDRDVLWKSPRVQPHRVDLHDNFDDHWAGGWDEGFPNGVPLKNRYGDDLPYFGELWSMPWSWRITDNSASNVELVMELSTPITPARWRRTLQLGSEPLLKISYHVDHTGYMPFDFNWGIHPCLDLTPGLRLDTPALRGEVANEWGGGALGKEGDTYDWPMLGKLDLRKPLGPDSASFALHYLTGYKNGWIAATDVASKRGFGLVFDADLFKVIWLWQCYGGWRGYHHVIMEPWTGYPTSLHDAIAGGRARVLNPGELLDTEVVAALYSGVTSVSRLDADGRAEA
jgi:galactose mutarotase-like enzyme